MAFSSNVQPSFEILNLGRVDPISFAASDVHQSGWVDAGSGAWVQAIVQIGAITSGGVITATWLQATSSGGAGSKALTGGNFASTAYSTASTVNVIEERPEQLDLNNGFRWVRLVLTCTVNTVVAGATVNVGPQRFVSAVSPAS